MAKKKTHEQFLEDLKRVNGNVEVIDKYEKSSIPITCQCTICGKIWKIKPNNLLSGYGCPDCGVKKRALSQAKTQAQFVSEMEDVNSNIEIIGKYSGARNLILCKCKICNASWEAMPTNLLRGKGCPECKKAKISEKKLDSPEAFKEKAKNVNPKIVLLEPYTKSTNKIRVKCSTCGFEWSPKAVEITQGHGCPKCAGRIVTHEEFVVKLFEINPFVLVLGEYSNTITPIECKCLRCNNIWKAKPANLLSGSGCPVCFHSDTSFFEQVIFLSFSLALKDKTVISRDRKTIGKELDVYIPELKLAVEPGSWRWHKEKMRNDIDKQKLCEEKGIRLIIVYSDYKESKEPPVKDCITAVETFGYEKEHEALKAIIEKLFIVCGVNYAISDNEWKLITTEAYSKSRRMTTEEFSNKLRERNFEIEVVGEYTGAWNKITVRCMKCGHEWGAIANNLVRGHGCPICNRKRYSQR